MRALSYERQHFDVASIEPETCVCVESLNISFSPTRSLEGIQRFQNLRELRIWYCRNLHDIREVEYLPLLTTVVFYSTPKLKDYSSLSVCARLQRVSLNGPYKIDSIGWIEDLKELEYLQLSRVKVQDGDFMAIVRSESLRRVFWHGAPFPPPALAKIRVARPDLVIGGNSMNDK